MTAGSGIEYLPITIGESVFTEVLSSGMYDPFGAANELTKNAVDSMYVKLSRPRQESFDAIVEMMIVDGHPLAQKGKSLIILDYGQGLVEASLKRFLTVGSDEVYSKSSGVFDQKRIGRIAAFALLKNHVTGFYLFSSTSKTGDVRKVHVTSSGLRQGRIESQWIPRDDSELYGLCPDDSFAMVVIPDVIPAITVNNSFAKDLRLRVPQRPSEKQFYIRLNDEMIEPPPLPTELVVEEAGISGHFEKVTGKKGRKGVHLCDADTGTIVANGAEMARFLPYPLGRPEFGGRLFISGLITKQNTSRSGLRPDFLKSEEWKAICRNLIDHFCKPLSELLGEEGIIRRNSFGNSLRDIAKKLNQAFGAPPRQKLPKGITTPEGDVEAEKKGGAGGGSKKTGGEKKKRKRRPGSRGLLIKYKEKAYVLAVRDDAADISAEFFNPNIIFLNQKDPMLKVYAAAPAALTRHLVEAIIGAIEVQDPALIFDAPAFQREVKRSLNEFYKVK